MRNIMNKIALRTTNMNHNVDKSSNWDWGPGVAMYGLVRFYEATGDENIISYIKKFIDEAMDQAYTRKSVNTTAPAMACFKLYELYSDERYITICRDYAEFLMNEASREKNGAIEHSLISRTKVGEVWIDTVFMAGVFLVKAGCIFGRDDYIKEGLKQFVLHIQILQDECGLFYHAYSHNTQNHMSGCLWGRGNGWFTASVAEIMKLLENKEFYEEKEIILSAVKKQAKALISAQCENGMWCTILTDNESYNESSATAAFAYGMFAGVRMGYLDEKFLMPAQKALDAIVGKTGDDGRVYDVSHGTGVRETIPDYNLMPKENIMPWGQGLAIMLMSEKLYGI